VNPSSAQVCRSIGWDELGEWIAGVRQAGSTRTGWEVRLSYRTVRTYRDPIEAELGRARLESEGIDSVIADDGLIAMQWDLSFAVGGAKLKVAEMDHARASEILDEDRSGELATLSESLSAPADEVRCPDCGSLEVDASSARRRWAALSLLSGLPLVFGRREWVCRVCRQVWPRRTQGSIGRSAQTIEAERRVHQQSGPPTVLIAFATFLAIVLIAHSRLGLSIGS